MTADVERPVICSKCGAKSGDDWKQCHGVCPLPDSPHHKATADKVELLPLPKWAVGLRHLQLDALGLQSRVQEYACANVAHATAAKDAEIEALRAEVDEWKAIATWEKEQHDRLFKEARALNERAEHLAEALREAKRLGDQGDWRAERAVICAALHPTAAQENGRD